MHAQLQSLIDDYQRATERLHRLRGAVSPNRWAERPASGGWSVAECIAHLNLTAEAYLPLLRDALERARMTGGGAPARFRLGLVGWLIHRMAGPGSRTRIKTSAAFVPSADADAEQICSRFDRLQAEQIALLRGADGLPLHRVKVGSPFSDRVRYNTFAAFAIQAAHQQRHMDQAERVWEEIRART